MKTSLVIFCAAFVLLFSSCSSSRKTTRPQVNDNSTLRSTVVIKNKVPVKIINTKNVSANELVKFAETLKGIRYKYGSMKKENGFDCSGFISYVFTHFKIPVPRTSVDFTNAGKEVLPEFSRRGDIILFTGSNAKSGVVGHMGIITQNKNGDIQFIHASESRGVMISGMNSYFLPRFVKVNRVFSNFK